MRQPRARASAHSTKRRKPRRGPEPMRERKAPEPAHKVPKGGDQCGSQARASVQSTKRREPRWGPRARASAQSTKRRNQDGNQARASSQNTNRREPPREPTKGQIQRRFVSRLVQYRKDSASTKCRIGVASRTRICANHISFWGRLEIGRLRL